MIICTNSVAATPVQDHSTLTMKRSARRRVGLASAGAGGIPLIQSYLGSLRSRGWGPGLGVGPGVGDWGLGTGASDAHAGETACATTGQLIHLARPNAAAEARPPITTVCSPPRKGEIP